MGPKASTPVDNTQTFQQLKISHPLFATAKLIKGSDDQSSLIQTQIRLANKSQFDSWSLRVSQVPQNQSLMLPISQYYTTQGFCGNSGIAHITYPNFPYLLSDEITNRECLQKKLFEEKELWYLVYTLLSAAFTYHKEGRKVGDIRPDNIFINEDGQVQVACIDSWPGQQTNYAKAFYQKQITYLSPQQIKDYQFGKMQQSVDLQLAQTFSIGLTSLDAATLSQSKSLYKKNFKFDYQRLEERIAEFKTYGYSELLCLTIQTMCEVDTELRTSSREILNWLLPYEESIVNLESFQVNGVPEKMRLLRERLQQQQQGNSMLMRNSQFIGSTYVQPSTYSVQSGPVIPTYVQTPIMVPTYNPPASVYRPQSYIPPPPLTIQPQSKPISYTFTTVSPLQTGIINPNQGLQNYYAVNSTTVNNNPNGPAMNGVVGQTKFTLQQINQQLQESRRLFPQ